MGKSVETDLKLNGNELQSVSFEKLASDPLAPTAGQYWLNTTSNKAKFFDGAVVHVLTDELYVQSLIQQIGQSQGGFDASAGLLPTVADLIDGDTVIRRGDYWDITAEGSIAGISGDALLSIGDVLKFVGTVPSNPAHWLGIQRNLNDTLLGNVKGERQTVNLVAHTPLTVSAATVADVFSIHTYNSEGDEIIIDVKRGLLANQRILTANRSLTGVIVELMGATA
jgi:hypothetical protein